MVNVKVVGLRELKNRLSEYIRDVRGGEIVLVTDRGIVVAEMKKPGETLPRADMDPGLVELAKQGLLSLGRANEPSVYPRLPQRLSGPAIQALLQEERGTR